MRMDKLTNQLQSALADAQSLALGKDHNFIEPVHLLGALLEQQGGSARPLLQKAGADLNNLRAEVQALASFGSVGQGSKRERYWKYMAMEIIRPLKVKTKALYSDSQTIWGTAEEE